MYPTGEIDEILDQDLSQEPVFKGWYWWQERRGYYNLTIGSLMIFTLVLCWEFGFEAHWNYIAIATLITLAVANILYSLPVLLEWLVFKFSKGKSQLRRWRFTAFWLGLIFSVIIVIGCAVTIAGDVSAMIRNGYLHYLHTNPPH